MKNGLQGPDALGAKHQKGWCGEAEMVSRERQKYLQKATKRDERGERTSFIIPCGVFVSLLAWPWGAQGTSRIISASLPHNVRTGCG